METILPILDEAMEIEDQLLLKNKFVDIHQIISLDSRRSVPKVFGFAENIVQSYSDIQFRADFRISKVTFERLVLELSPLIEYDDRPDGKEALDVRKQILVFMWYISNQDSMREIASRFGISKSTVFRCIRRVSCALCDIRSKLIKWPDIETQQEISEAVERRCKVPNVIGFIDGTHIRLSCCPGDDNSYINRKRYPSIVLQLIVDDRLVIRDCYVGWPGSTHDARVFRNSPIFTSLQTGQAVLGRDNFLIGKSDRYHFMYAKKQL
jgi:predicted DNA-binding protein YlxM (UPF0122 family)